MHSPFKATTFNNMAVEAHLKVLNLNKNIFFPKDFVLEDTFFIKHISEIIQDDIWDKKTLDDLYEAIRVVYKLKIKKQLFIYLRLVKHLIVKPIVEIFSRHNSVSNGSGDTYSFVLGDEHGFANLAECSKFIEAEYASNSSVSVDCVFITGYPYPPKIDGHILDVYAKTLVGESVVIGESKTPLDLESPRTKEQLTAFINYLDKRQKSVLVVATR